ncbi:MAG: iron-containing alcohol dehydrogenase [Bacteriovoracaceae bacterium]
MNYDWNTRYNYNFPTLVRFGKGVIEELGPHLKEQGLKNVLMVSDAGLTKLPVFDKVVEGLKKCGLTVTIFSDIAKNPVKSNVLKGAETFKNAHCDSIVGFGGGASMDVARAIALKAHHTLDLFDYDDAIGGDQHVTGPVPYFVTVPTTSGTGSEVGRSTVIADDVTHEKKILFSPKLMAKKVFADPELSMGLPAFVTAATGMDALTHNIEAYLSKGFSPMCDGVALEGIRLISQSLERATNNPDLESRSKMMMGALMGATAFQKGLGIVHSLAHPLSTLSDMHHGLANAIMLPYGMEFNKSVSGPRMSIMAQTIGLKDQSPESFINWIMDLNKKVNIPAKLSAQNVTTAHLEKLSDLAFKDPCWSCNEKPVTKKDFFDLYTKAL